MPVDQTGENILFVMAGDTTEAHIQIQYDPDTEAAEFAWVVPITQLPTFSVGSDRLFQNILAGTVPTYGFTTTSSNGDCFASGDDGGATSGADEGGGDSTGGGGGPDVVFEDTVGAFDIVVLSGGTSSEVMTWLGDNGYQQDPAAEPILEQYLAEGYLFAAFRLTNGAETAEIHPIVLTFANDEACVPLRLTRIAAQDDMDVRAFFLADNRVVPDNYKHVLVNPLKLDWNNNASNYKDPERWRGRALAVSARARGRGASAPGLIRNVGPARSTRAPAGPERPLAALLGTSKYARYSFGLPPCERRR